MPQIQPVQRIRFHLAAPVLAALDIAGVSVLTTAAYRASIQPAQADWADVFAFLAGAIVAWLLAAQAVGLYSRARLLAGRSLVPPALATCALSCLPALLAAAAWASGGTAAQTALLAAFAGLMVWVALTRAACGALIKIAVQRGGCLQSAMVLAGSLSAARILAAEFERQTGGRTRVAVSALIPGVPGSPTADWVEGTIRIHGIDRIVIAGHGDFAGMASAMLMRLRAVSPDVGLIPDNGVVETGAGRGAPFSFAVPALDEPCNALSRSQAAGKRALDILCAAAALLITAPALLAIAVAIKFDSPGPVIFRQKRIGLHGKLFSIWKFRTMYSDMRDEHCQQQTGRDDPRVTPVGRFLRRTSLDELPQVMNVLFGDMSIVGPRPHAIGMTVSGRRLTDLAAGYAARHRMRPGITGWAQVNGCRGEIDGARKLRRRIALDCHYIENWSFGLDILIMLRTAALLFADRHAY